MNENLNLVEILKYCPVGTKLYSTVFGNVEFSTIIDTNTIIVTTEDNNTVFFSAYGKMYTQYDGECLLFPSREQRDWSKFKINKPKFDPKTLKPFDKVLVKKGDKSYNVWFPDFISLPPNDVDKAALCMTTDDVVMAIPYNDDTKHLVGTSEEAPEFYTYWED